MKPSKLMQASSDMTYNSKAPNGLRLEVNSAKSINPWLLGLAALSAFSIIVMFVMGVPKNIKQTYFEPSQMVKEQEAKSPNEFMQAYIWTARLKLEDLKLNHRLKITSDNANDLVVKGNISKQEAKNWLAFLNWYEGKQGFPNLKHSVETNATSSNIPELISVWFDTKPTAYFADGRSGGIGTAFDDGWKIISIEAWAVFVERNGTTVMLNY